MIASGPMETRLAALSRRVDYMVLSHLPAAEEAQVYGKSTSAATAPPETDGGKANPNPEQQGGWTERLEQELDGVNPVRY